MNRQIKFRAWDIDKKEFRYAPGEELNIIFEPCHIFELGKFPVILNHLEYLQFIGKKDNQGREIYEGDIVKFDICGVTHGRYRENDCQGSVWYNEEKAYWAIGKFKNEYFEWHWSFSDDIDEKTLTIIGNVFENKELIK